MFRVLRKIKLVLGKTEYKKLVPAFSDLFGRCKMLPVPNIGGGCQRAFGGIGEWLEQSGGTVWKRWAFNSDRRERTSPFTLKASAQSLSWALPMAL